MGLRVGDENLPTVPSPWGDGWDLDHRTEERWLGARDLENRQNYAENKTKIAANIIAVY